MPYRLLTRIFPRYLIRDGANCELKNYGFYCRKEPSSKQHKRQKHERAALSIERYVIDFQ